MLSWVKVEKQLRRLFSYLVYQNPAFSKTDQAALVAVFVAHKRLYWESFIRCIDAHGPVTVKQLIGASYEEYIAGLSRVRDYRNKILHGQITGQNLTSRQLEADVTFLRGWIERLAAAAHARLGYDGIGRNTFHKAKVGESKVGAIYPFSTVAGFKKWLALTLKD